MGRLPPPAAACTGQRDASPRRLTLKSGQRAFPTESGCPCGRPSPLRLDRLRRLHRTQGFQHGGGADAAGFLRWNLRELPHEPSTGDQRETVRLCSPPFRSLVGSPVQAGGAVFVSSQVWVTSLQKSRFLKGSWARRNRITSFFPSGVYFFHETSHSGVWSVSKLPLVTSLKVQCLRERTCLRPPSRGRGLGASLGARSRGAGVWWPLAFPRGQQLREARS